MLAIGDAKMPVKSNPLNPTFHQHYQNLSAEELVASWLTHDGWEVLAPVVDHGRKTDLVVSDGKCYYRLQIKTVDGKSESQEVENRWQGGDASIDYVIFIGRNANWGYVAPAFKEKRRILNSEGHIRFHQHQKNFAKAFAQI